MSKHTPGPWICYADLPSVEPNWHIVTTENRMRVLANVHIEPGNQMDEANARLIAAAPDLLAALKAIERHNDNPARYDSYVNRIVVEAIAKAEGSAAPLYKGGE